MENIKKETNYKVLNGEIYQYIDQFWLILFIWKGGGINLWLYFTYLAWGLLDICPMFPNVRIPAFHSSKKK